MLDKSKGFTAFLAAVVVVVAAFVATASFVLVQQRSIGTAARTITQNAVPSIELLLDARQDVALLRLRTERYVVRGRPELAGREALWDTYSELRRTLSLYFALPNVPEEHLRYAELSAAVDRVGRSLRRVVAATGATEGPPAESLLDQEFLFATERLELALARSEELNTDAVRDVATHVEETYSRSRRNLLLLNALCVLLAGGLLAWALKSARRHRDLQDQLLRFSRERAAELEAFAGRVAHDILSPLSAASVVLGRLSRSGEPEVARLAQTGQASIVRVKATVDGLFAFAKAGAMPEPGATTDLATVTRDVVEGMEGAAAAAGVTLEVRCDGRPAVVAASRGVLTSMVTNLVQNAIRYIGERAEKRVAVTVSSGYSTVRVEVADTGPGIPPDLEQRIFEPYFRGRDRATAGLGLGLATLKRLVDRHAGALGVTSCPGNGSMFWFELPRVRHAEQPHETPGFGMPSFPTGQPG